MKVDKNIELYSDEAIGKRIKQLAKDKEYTQDQLSAKSNLEVATISRMYRGYSLTAQNINAIALAMEADVGYIMTGNNSDEAVVNGNQKTGKIKSFILDKFSTRDVEQLNQLYAVAKTFNMVV